MKYLILCDSPCSTSKPRKRWAKGFKEFSLSKRPCYAGVCLMDPMGPLDSGDDGRATLKVCPQAPGKTEIVGIHSDFPNKQVSNCVTIIETKIIQEFGS